MKSKNMLCLHNEAELESLYNALKQLSNVGPVRVTISDETAALLMDKLPRDHEDLCQQIIHAVLRKEPFPFGTPVRSLRENTCGFVLSAWYAQENEHYHLFYRYGDEGRSYVQRHDEVERDRTAKPLDSVKFGRLVMTNWGTSIL